MLNFLVAKEKRLVKMVDGSACEVIGIRTVKGTERDGMVRALEAVQYVPKALYNLISIGCSTKKDAGSKCNKASSQLTKETG